MKNRSHRDLRVYELARSAAFQLQNITKSFPAEEQFSLTDQVRRSSRSVCACIAEAWRKRRYKANFISKLTEAEGEAEETRVWIEFAAEYDYIETSAAEALDDQYDHILAQLVIMISNPDKWLLPRSPSRPLSSSPSQKNQSKGQPDLR